MMVASAIASSLNFYMPDATPHAMKIRGQTDVAIIGGGITGILAAYLLRNTGKKVTIFEKGKVGEAATAASTAFLMEQVEIAAEELLKTRGEETARLIYASHRNAISRIEEIAHKESLTEAEFARSTFYEYAESEKDVKDLKKEAELLKRFGCPAHFDSNGAHEITKFGALVLENQAKMHAGSFTHALADVARKSGINIHEHTEVKNLREEKEHVVIETNDGYMEAKQVLIATHYPFHQGLALYFKKARYLTYVVKAEIPKGALPEVLYEDTYNPYHYARVDRGDHTDTLMIGGEDHRADIKVPEEKNYRALEAYMRKRFPMAGKVVGRWKGSIIESGEGLAFIGVVKNSRIFYATAYRGTGITYAYIAAELSFQHSGIRSLEFT